ncbi:hypothetical protein E3Q23_00813 [Wallemia mellicola]|nr:hypothetical protein E3Q23_00813 [Wallemia mellicola]
MTAPACIGREILYVGAVLSVVNSEAIHNMANLMKDWVLRKWGFYDYKSNEPTRRGIIGYERMKSWIRTMYLLCHI